MSLIVIKLIKGEIFLSNKVSPLKEGLQLTDFPVASKKQLPQTPC